MKDQNTPVHIALTFDQNYLVPFYVLVTSIFLNNKKNKIVLHTIATGVNEIEIKKILEFVKSNGGKIYFYSIDESFRIDNLNTPYLNSTHFTVAIFYRLFFPFLISENIDSLLYIDTDTIVLGDLHTLYSTNLNAFPVGVAIDTGMRRYNDPLLQKIGVDKDKYFNSGVLLINLKEWKKQKISENTLQFTLENQHVLKYPDQDALNYVLKDNYYKLSNSYNFTWNDISEDIPKKEILKQQIVILHYTAIKPWNMLNSNRLRYYYHYYLKKSPLAGSKIYTDFEWTRKKILLFLKIRMVEFYLDHVWMRNAWKNIKSLKQS